MEEAQPTNTMQSMFEELRELLKSLAKRPDGFLSLEEASAFLGGMPIKTLQEKTPSEIPGYKLGRHVVYDPKDLREYVKRRKK